MPSFDETVEFEVEILRKSIAAFLVSIDGDTEAEYWFPFSQIDESSEIQELTSDVGDAGTLVVSEWIATEKGLT